MFRYFLLLALVSLGVWTYFQQQELYGLRSEVEGYRREYWDAQINEARAEGAFIGLSTSTEARMFNLRASLTTYKNLVGELREVLLHKDHLIQSLQEGQVLTVTAYSPTVDQCDDTPFITANNNRVRDGIVAVSPDLFSRGWVFGRKVYVVDYGVYEIDDLMAQRMQNTIDIFMFNRQHAVSFGKKQLRVYLLGA